MLDLLCTQLLSIWLFGLREKKKIIRSYIIGLSLLLTYLVGRRHGAVTELFKIDSSLLLVNWSSP